MDTIILNSELEFQEYVITHQDDIISIVIAYDKLEEIMLFYSFLDNLIVATAKKTKDYSHYLKTYNEINNKLNLTAITDNKNKVLRLVK